MTQKPQNLDNIIDNEIKKYEKAISMLDELPGVGKQSAQTILAEIGLDINRFPTPSNLASLTGLCPGNNESAGKQKSGKTCRGNYIIEFSYRTRCGDIVYQSRTTLF